MFEESKTNPSEAICPVHVLCGGCPLIASAPVHQRAEKGERVRRAIEDATGCEVGKPEWSTGATEAYRNRMRMKVSDDGRVSFFNAEKNAGCIVLAPDVWKRCEILIAQTPKTPLVGLEHVEVRGCDRHGQAAVVLYGASAGMHKAEVHTFFDGDTNIYAMPADQHATQFFGEARPEIPVGAFMQIHHEVAGYLESFVEGAFLQSGCNVFVDVFCGAGAFASKLAPHAKEGGAIDVDGPAIGSLERYFDEGQATKVHALRGDAFEEQWPYKLSFLSPNEGFAVVNPPRAGIKEACWLDAWMPHDLVLSLCNIDVVGRDLSQLVKRGYKLKDVRCFDMFPHTAHAEIAMHLSLS